MTLSEFWEYVAVERRQRPEWRYGQTVFNTLAVARPELADQLIGTEIDPYYRQGKRPDDLPVGFAVWLITHWGG